MSRNGLTRRGFVGGATALGTAGVLLAGESSAVAAEAPGQPVLTVDPADQLYIDLTSRCYNGRFIGSPDYVQIVHSTDQVVAAVQEAVNAGRRIAVRSGGHCLEDLVDDPAVKAVIDVSEMDGVDFDRSRQAFVVVAGATLGHVYRTLYLEWGVTVPGGTCPTVGVGGHVTGGGYGALTRKYGSIVDHLDAVEVVVVDSSGTARAVVATRDPGDPDQDLWWAHTGGGGGNFGVVTRFWFRSPDAQGTDPAGLLPTPPRQLYEASVSWPWAGLTETDFITLVRNHGAWHERNSTYGSPYDNQHSLLDLHNVGQDTITLTAQTDAGLPNAAGLTQDYISAVSNGVSVPATVATWVWPWMKATLRDIYDTGTFNRTKSKGAYLRQGWSDEQAATLYRYLSDPTYDGHAGILLYAYGCKVNTVDSAATAMPQRDSILKANFTTYWSDPTEDDKHLTWMRELYRDVYASTGAVPAPDAANDGSYINYPDVDLKDPAWNTSGISWESLYYKGNLPRLQRIKAAWDPLNVFYHALSITPN